MLMQPSLSLILSLHSFFFSHCVTCNQSSLLIPLSSPTRVLPVIIIIFSLPPHDMHLNEAVPVSQERDDTSRIFFHYLLPSGRRTSSPPLFPSSQTVSLLPHLYTTQTTCFPGTRSPRASFLSPVSCISFQVTESPKQTKAKANGKRLAWNESLVETQVEEEAKGKSWGKGKRTLAWRQKTGKTVRIRGRKLSRKDMVNNKEERRVRRRLFQEKGEHGSDGETSKKRGSGCVWKEEAKFCNGPGRKTEGKRYGKGKKRALCVSLAAKRFLSPLSPSPIIHRPYDYRFTSSVCGCCFFPSVEPMFFPLVSFLRSGEEEDLHHGRCNRFLLPPLPLSLLTRLAGNTT